ncbi:uncharacterized protein EAF02_001321 [Botrytis sinoallii]|uniref:uncharacterized protein n=1 Tax=Botrytis sinoallii TaxID=1463999 RepID=UPI001902A944|nr:uncharacterized protein EAF02_001321 [Botrytis sinoallii]KAF7890996.1 hypothetical protein EAF02_001321 [Botrytis sinoallii]
MAYRVPRNRKENFTPTNGQLSISSSTKLPPGPWAVKKERPATKDLQGTVESQAQLEQPRSDPDHHFDNRYSTDFHYIADQKDRSESATINMENGDGIKRIGELPQKLIDHINKLGKFDLSHVVSLARLILIGDQSAGKSSLMCALAGIHVPRDKGCCTRCPANITTSPSADWSCTISLVQDYRYDAKKGQRVTIKDINKNQPFPPWVRQERVQVEFARLTEKLELANYMRWAQIALLNHNQDYRQFIPGTGARALADNTDIEAKITPNVVKVDIFGPELPALSFYDLPGIISNMPNPEEKYLVDVFENLAIKYIKEPNTLIIFAMSMTVDPVLSRAKKVIEDLDATKRCVGVLTKPDTLADKTGNADFENILRGKEHRLGYGWLVARQPGPEFRADESKYHEEARKEEEEFFRCDPLWNGAWSEFKNKCGTSRIQTVLSELLVTSIKEDIPDIKKKVSAHRAKITEDLRNLPELPDQNVQLEVQRLLQNFSREVKGLMTSEHTDTNFHGNWTKLSQNFHKLLLHIKPMIICSHPSDTYQIPVISVDDSDDEEPGTVPAPDTSGKKRKYPNITKDQSFEQDGRNSENVTPVSKLRFKSEAPSPRTPRPIRNARNLPNKFKGTVFERHAELGKGFASIGDIQKEMLNSSLGLPKIVDPRIHQAYCRKAVSVWKDPYTDLLFAATKLLRSAVHTVVERNLGIYQQTILYKDSKILVDRWIDDLCKQQLSAIENLYQTEIYRPFTLLGDAINESKKVELQKLQQGRHKHRASCLVDKQLSLGLKKIKAEKQSPEYINARQALVEAVKNEDLDRDPFEVQLDVAAYVRGYYVVAANRFADSVCISINNCYFRNVVEQVENYLEMHLGTNDPSNGKQKSQDLMQEDNKVAEERRRLQREVKNLADFETQFMKLVADCNGREVAEYSDPRLTSPEEANRSETPENEQPRYRGQSPVEDMMNRRAGVYDYDDEMRQAQNRGRHYVNDSLEIDEV